MTLKKINYTTFHNIILVKKIDRSSIFRYLYEVSPKKTTLLYKKVKHLHLFWVSNSNHINYIDSQTRKETIQSFNFSIIYKCFYFSYFK